MDNICNLKYSIPKEMLVVFHRRLIYDYHLIIIELKKEFEQEFERLGKVHNLLFSSNRKRY